MLSFPRKRYKFNFASVLNWDTQKQLVPIQQTEGTSLANAGDGRADVYPLVQSEQIHARFGGTDPLRDWQQQTERRQHRGETPREKRGMEDWMPSNEFCDTLYVHNIVT
jgi:hypothetical protein